MARKLTLIMDGEPIELALNKLDRDKLYGYKETIAVDGQDVPLKKEYLDEWGSVLIDQTGTGYLDESRRWQTRDELVQVDETDHELALYPSTFDEAVPLEERISMRDFLDYEISTVYQLDGYAVEGLAEKLSAHDGLFCFSFNYRAGYQPKTAFLNPTEEGLFMMVGSPIDADYLVKPMLVELDAEGDEDDDDDLDFSMM